MKKDFQRFVLAIIVGSLAVMTGCGKNNNDTMKNGQKNGKEQKEDRSRSMMDQKNDQDSMYRGDKDVKPSDDDDYTGC